MKNLCEQEAEKAAHTKLSVYVRVQYKWDGDGIDGGRCFIRDDDRWSCSMFMSSGHAESAFLTSFLLEIFL